MINLPLDADEKAGWSSISVGPSDSEESARFTSWAGSSKCGVGSSKSIEKVFEYVEFLLKSSFVKSCEFLSIAFLPEFWRSNNESKFSFDPYPI